MLSVKANSTYYTQTQDRVGNNERERSRKQRRYLMQRECRSAPHREKEKRRLRASSQNALQKGKKFL